MFFVNLMNQYSVVKTAFDMVKSANNMFRTQNLIQDSGLDSGLESKDVTLTCDFVPPLADSEKSVRCSEPVGQVRMAPVRATTSECFTLTSCICLLFLPA